MFRIFIFSCLLAQLRSQDQTTFQPSQHPKWNTLEHKKCGGGSSTARISAGVDSPLGDFPWLAGLILTQADGTEVKYACCGSILTKKTILTAASCVAFPEAGAKISQVVLGDWDKVNDNVCDDCHPPKQKFYPKEIIIHSKYPEFHKTSKQYDIALIRLEQEMEWHSYVFPICLLEDYQINENHVGKNVTIAGWGIWEYETNKTRDRIQKEKMKIEESCSFPSLLSFTISSNQVCTYGLLNEKAPCYGDGGGPLMLVNETVSPARTYAFGIISTIRNPCFSEAPTVSTRISSFMEWILDNLSENKKDYLVVDSANPFSGIKN